MNFIDSIHIIFIEAIPLRLLLNKITPIHSNTTQVYYNSSCYIYKRSTCFDLYLGHPQACQYKNLTKKDKNVIYSFLGNSPASEF